MMGFLEKYSRREQILLLIAGGLALFLVLLLVVINPILNMRSNNLADQCHIIFCEEIKAAQLSCFRLVNFKSCWL